MRNPLARHPGPTTRPVSVVLAIRAFEKATDKSVFVANLLPEERSRIQAIADRLATETEGGWTATEYEQYATIAWFLERWDAEAKDVRFADLDARSVDAIHRYRRTLLEAMRTVRASRTKADFFDKLKSFALEASREAGTLKIEFEAKEPERAANLKVAVYDPE